MAAPLSRARVWRVLPWWSGDGRLGSGRPAKTANNYSAKIMVLREQGEVFPKAVVEGCRWQIDMQPTRANVNGRLAAGSPTALAAIGLSELGFRGIVAAPGLGPQPRAGNHPCHVSFQTCSLWLVTERLRPWNVNGSEALSFPCRRRGVLFLFAAWDDLVGSFGVEHVAEQDNRQCELYGVV